MDEQDNVVIVSSDSEEDEATTWTKKAKMRSFKTLWEQAKDIIFHHHSSQLTSTFPYEKLEQLLDDLQKAANQTYSESTRIFLWKNAVQWVNAMRLSYDGIADLNYDDRFHLILTKFMASYINHECKIYAKMEADRVEFNSIDKINGILFLLNTIFSGNASSIIMTFLRVEVKAEYCFILFPMFEKYLKTKSLFKTDDFITYLMLVLCYRLWKKLVFTKEDKEAINEIAVGKCIKVMRAEDVSVISDGILPKAVPEINTKNRMFVGVSDLVRYAAKQRNYGTRILLVNKSLDEEEAIDKYFKQYERYISSGYNGELCEQAESGKERFDTLYSPFYIFHFMLI